MRRGDLGLRGGALGDGHFNEPPRQSLTVAFENGDRVLIACPKGGPCHLDLLVAGKQFVFDQADLGAEILPVQASLYSWSLERADRHFSF